MSAEQTPAGTPLRFHPEALKLAGLMMNGVRNSFERADGPIYVEACLYTFSMLLVAGANEGKGAVLLRQAAWCLERMAADASFVEAMRVFMASGDQVRH